MPAKYKYKVLSYWPKIALYSAKFICGLNWTIKGIEHIPSNGDFIILSNHQSTWETLFFISILPKNVCYVYKRELHWIPFFGWGLALLNMIPINRSKGAAALRQMIKKWKNKLDGTHCLIIFPEGSRSPSNKIGKFKLGSAILALETKSNIVPVALNSGKFWKAGSIAIHPGDINVSIGPMIQIEKYTKAEEVTKSAYEWIKHELLKIETEDSKNS
ncbi:lysophospholipid acyltransferase family protein [Candidatus Kinetoplastidibacterium blastocrithidiae]|uniref:lysophospholipid acyltransferase family protein n=1 Tax=Candidatus Kinetoplastidibacterium blastocrithidiae TaxID=233181 RepID=UPI0002A6631C|nr:lysophospholipid acyltransferase family protein [Candidatus Kinetoplastibacterium blastocrithidii]AFZ83869.1 1-acyl-sn-glycerol-3-phosphate acyltransferase [Candidatus Kinetoplastibacterium blastocrithidii (ex Strigomonas culicis)]